MESTLTLLRNHPVSIPNKERVLYYQIVSKLLFIQDESSLDGEKDFIEFMKPFEARLNQFATMNTLEEFQQNQVENK